VLPDKNKPTTFLHFFINIAKGLVLFHLTVALVLFANAFIYGSSTQFVIIFLCVESINKYHLNWHKVKNAMVL